MSDVETRFHETWLGMAQPVEGLVVSIPVLVEAQILRRLSPEAQQRLLELCPPVGEARKGEAPERAIGELSEFLSRVLDLTPDLFDAGDGLPEELRLDVLEGRQTIRPTLALRRQGPAPEPEPAAGPADASTPASRAGAPYLLLVWEIPDGVPFAKPETVTGLWEYPPARKFERLLRHARVPIGLPVNGRAVRLIYAPHGESTGSVTFHIDDMASPGGRPLLDAFVMLLSSFRLLGDAPEHRLPALLAESRKRQANVTEKLAGQVLEAIEALLAGFEAAAERDGGDRLDEALRREPQGDHVYGGLLTVLLRLVFLLYAESKALLPVESRFYAEHLSVLGLFDQLKKDHGAFPDSLSRRFGAWGRLLALFRVVYAGAHHGDLHMPPRRGQLFDPDEYPFLEGWGPGGSAPMTLAEDRAAVRVPSVDDGTVYRVLEKLVIFEGQRLSYAALDVEQIGSVYEAVMGYHVERVYSPAVCLKPERVWVRAEEVLEHAPARRAKWLQEHTGLPKSQAEKLAEALRGAGSDGAVLAVLDGFAVKGMERARPGRLVLQPGEERRRTSSHYTPRSLTGPIVKKTLEPLLATMGPEPPSALILELRICDPAMGSGAFLVEACRYLADQLVAAWTREGRHDLIAGAHEDVINHAKRLVAQRCLYGVDKNRFAVNLAKLSLWLETLAKDLPFTFLNHALRHGDSLVGLTFEQIRGFHWSPEKQLDFCSEELDRALSEAITLRQEIQDLVDDPSPEAQREKERLLWDAEDATRRVRLIADLVVGAFFSSTKEKERRQELNRRVTLVHEWLESGEPGIPEDLEAMQDETRDRVPFHWMLEFPEVFFAERPDPLDGGKRNGAAWMDGFVGNPPFAGKNTIVDLSASYIPWLLSIFEDAHGNADLSSYFFRRCDTLLGRNGTLGLIATNTIAQGDTRSTGLRPLLERGVWIYDAIRSKGWPGAAGVSVAVVHLAKGQTKSAVADFTRLDGLVVRFINSRLRPKAERADPEALSENLGKCSQGSIPQGAGFLLTPQEAEVLLAKEPRNSERIFLFIGGEELNSSPDLSSSRYAINFGSMSLDEAERWPDLVLIVRERVKPERDKLKDNTIGSHQKKYWWRFWADRPELYRALGGLARCVLTPQTSRHRVFAFQPTDRIFSQTLCVFTFEDYSRIAVLQSRVHEGWSNLLSSTLEERLRYIPSDCFFTFPFPDPRTVIPELEDIGQRLYETRAKYMVDTWQGLTDTYNLLKDPSCHDPRIEELRRLHEEMDRAVLAAYGWSDIPVPPYGTPVSEEEKRALEAFEDEVIDRLFVLNAQRAEEERRAALSATPEKKKPGRGRKPKAEGQMPLLP